MRVELHRRDSVAKYQIIYSLTCNFISFKLGCILAFVNRHFLFICSNKYSIETRYLLNPYVTRLSLKLTNLEAKGCDRERSLRNLIYQTLVHTPLVSASGLACVCQHVQTSETPVRLVTLHSRIQVITEHMYYMPATMHCYINQNSAGQYIYD